MESDRLSTEEVVTGGKVGGDLEVKLSTFRLSVKHI
jgi:hypothetical protein